MAIFAIIKQPGAVDNLDTTIRALFPRHYDLSGGAWLVSAPMTAQELSEKLGIVSGANGSALVLEVASYFGRANPAIWSWIKSNWGGTPVG